MRPSARRELGGSSVDTSLTTSRKPARTPRVSLAAVRVSRLPLNEARTPGLPVLSTVMILGSGSATPASR